MFKDLTREKFGRLTVVNRNGSRLVGNHGKYRALWLCRCDCGKEINIATISLTTSHTRSCGCIREDHPNRLRHGKARNSERSKAYQAWIGMKARCRNNPKERAYSNYAGRGILVCQGWLESFENLFEDMGEPLSSGRKIHLDRINNDLGYFKENCRWTTAKINARNRSITVKIEGVPLAEIAENNCLDYHALYHQVVTRKQGLSETLAKLIAQMNP